ncbi:MAG: HD domain-containing phosphohydrolase [Deltaproteobacteria bacterium]|nr:HD domain-containing phosphohydrolase [Deltaproteobacteria bacterium]
MKTVLVIDNDELIREFMKDLLTQDGYEVVTAADGLRALDVLTNLVPDFIFLDLVMPGIDGKKLCHIIRNKRRFDKTAIVIVSGYLAEMETDFDTFGIQGTVVKGPFDQMAKNIQVVLKELKTPRTTHVARETKGMEEIFPRKATRELLSITRHFELILGKMSEGILELTADRRVVYANESALDLIGNPEEDLLGSHFEDLFSGEDRRRVEEVLRSVSQGPQNISEAEPLLLKEYYISLSAVPINGQTHTIIIILNNVSERRRAELQLQESMADLKKALFGTIQALALTVERRDPYTAGHQQRVQAIATAIAEEMELDEDAIEGLQMAAFIHDIGKIAIPAGILSKPTRLDETEFRLLKTHPQVAHSILSSIYFPWPLAEIVLQHHERMDGSGYPRGLRGEEILMEARILAVADVVEAMGSHRPYRPSLGIDAALEEIRKNRGILYDERVADTCLFLFKEKGFSF